MASWACIGRFLCHQWQCSNPLELELRHVSLIDGERYTSIVTAMATVDAELIHQALKKNAELFAWTTTDSSAQKKRNHGKEKPWSRPRNSSRSVHPRGPVLNLASQRGDGYEVERQVANVRRLQRSEQGMPKRLIPSTQHRPTRWWSGRAQGIELLGRLFWWQPDKHAPKEQGENNLHDRRCKLLLRGNVVRPEEYKGHLPAVDGQNFQGND